MITKITIQNFKSLKDIELNCSNLNVLTGLNSMGKSSILQALLLLRQSYDKGYLAKVGLTLNGDLVKIGVGKDALFKGADKEEITIGFTFGELEMSWVFGYSKNIEDGEIENYHNSDILPFAEDFSPLTGIENLELFTDQFQYLNADRRVQNQYERSDFNVVWNRSLGKHGEFTAHFLDHFGTSKKIEVAETLLYPGTTDRNLSNQVSAWMNEISPGTIVKTFTSPGVDSVNLRYEFNTPEGPEVVLPTNTGFGVTYILPVIVALLSAKPGDLLIIENPESHVHPKGQSAIGRLIAMTCESGVQVFIETHSDHIINGICVALHKNAVQQSKVKVNFLTKLENQIQTSKYEVVINQDGRIDDSSMREANQGGFFDQINKDLETILFGKTKKD